MIAYLVARLVTQRTATETTVIPALLDRCILAA